MGKTTPVSLLACMMLTSSVSGRRARTNWPISRLPSRSTSSQVTRQPSRSRSLQTSSTAGCSTEVVMMCRRLRIGLGHAEDRRVVALRSAAGEEDRPGVGKPEVPGDRLPRPVEGLVDPPGRLVHRAGVEVALGEEGAHRLDDFRGDGGGGVVVGVNDSHRQSSVNVQMDVGTQATAISRLCSWSMALTFTAYCFHTSITRTRSSTISFSVRSTSIRSVWPAPLQPAQLPTRRQ